MFIVVGTMFTVVGTVFTLVGTIVGTVLTVVETPEYAGALFTVVLTPGDPRVSITDPAIDELTWNKF